MSQIETELSLLVAISYRHFKNETGNSAINYFTMKRIIISDRSSEVYGDLSLIKIDPVTTNCV